jgi:1,4-alpha-glucan branching enzyme
MVQINNGWVEFWFYRPGANRVNLVGDFNHWSESSLPMVRAERGYWRARLRLPEGEFRFRYCADGQWYTDYAAFGVEPGCFGLDSLVRVRRTALPAPAVEAASPAA